jgi:hypothetical protein
MEAHEVRQYIVFDAERLLDRTVRTLVEPDEAEKALKTILAPNLVFAVESLPAAQFVPYDNLEAPFVPQSVAVLVSSGDDEAEAESRARDVRASVEDLIQREGRGRIRDIGADGPLGLSDFSCLHLADPSLFGTRDDAHRLSGINAFFAAPNLNGAGVNVVIIDSGLDVALVPFGQWGGGWQPLPAGPLPAGPLPGSTTGKDALHGAMILQNILAVAPQARIWDVPLIRPPRIDNIGAFLAQAQGVFNKMTADIASMPAQQWVFMNAWAIFDRRSEFPFRDYTENRPGGPGNHPFITCINALAARNFDIIYCAGNCGGICPDERCGPNDFGPGRGIWGANAHASVLTVGAARMDSTWIGYSSEGPLLGPKLARDKPDLCAPSQYAENAGGIPANVGTSAAAALAAGVVAAIRSKWPQAVVAPSRLIQVLNQTTFKTSGPVWTGRIGNGVLNAQGAEAALP